MIASLIAIGISGLAFECRVLRTIEPRTVAR
jgi:hypothetical protein